MRRKARQRAAARAGEQEAAQPAAPSGAAAPPGAQEPAIEDALRAELERLGTAPPSPATMPGPPPEPAPPPAPALPAPPAPEALLDPLREFFWREDEPAPNLPDLGSAGAERSPAGSPTGELREHVAFLLGAEEYAVAIGRVREILKPPPITEVPRAPRHVLGVIAVRGEVVAVVDPRPRLALPPGSPGPSSRIVVCEGAGGPVGLLVDAVSQVVRLPPEAVEPRPPGVGGEAADVIAGIGRDGERLVILLDLDALLGAPAAREGAA